MKYVRPLIAAAAIATMLLPSTVAAQSNQASHTVSVTVQAINVLAVGGNVSLTIDSATPGSEPDFDEGSSTYALTTNSAAAMKITAATDVAMPTGLTLSATMASPASGSSAGSVDLTNSAQDMVSGITQVTGANLSISYRATATVDAEVTSTDFTVTYTLTAE